MPQRVQDQWFGISGIEHFEVRHGLALLTSPLSQPLGAYAKVQAEESGTGWVAFLLDESPLPAQTEVAKQTDTCVSWS